MCCSRSRLNYTEQNVRYLLHVALILSDAHKLLANNALVFIDQIIQGEDTTADVKILSHDIVREMSHLMDCFLEVYSVRSCVYVDADH